MSHWGTLAELNPPGPEGAVDQNDLQYVRAEGGAAVTGSHLAQFILFLHLPALVEVAQPDANVQPSVQLLLWVGFSRGHGGPLDAELHAGFLSRHLVAGAQNLTTDFRTEQKLRMGGQRSPTWSLS